MIQGEMKTQPHIASLRDRVIRGGSLSFNPEDSSSVMAIRRSVWRMGLSAIAGGQALSLYSAESKIDCSSSV
jgi:hypothetical protein